MAMADSARPCFSKILLYADPASEIRPAFRYAARMAKADKAQVTVVDCLDKTPSFLARMLLPASWDIPGVVAHDHQARLDSVAQALEREGVSAATKLLFGSPGDEITREVLRGGHDLVIKTAQGNGGRKESSLFGAVAIRLMRVCPCPVCVVDPREDQGFGRIAAAVDPESHDAEHLELNRKIVDLAATLAQRAGGELHVLHAWTAFGETVLSMRMPDDEIAHYVGRCEADARERLEELTANVRQRIPHAQTHLLHGDADQVISEFTRNHKIDLVVLGTVGRRGLQGAIMGNTAETIIHRVPCSVLAVKPDSFVCPIEVDSGEDRLQDDFQSSKHALLWLGFF